MDTSPYRRVDFAPSWADPVPFVWRPMMPVVLLGLKNRVKLVALVDTGASETVLPLHYWDSISPAFREHEEDELETANGSVMPVKYGTFDLAIRLGNRVHRWHAKVGFTDSREEMVLGDAGFLRFFTPTFDRAGKILTVRRSSAPLPLSVMTTTPTGPIARPS